MNCDDAFDALTDPLRRDGDDLRWHLDLCPRCRQMREILSPALDALAPFEEAAAPSALSEAALADGPAPTSPPVPLLTPEAVRLAERVAAELAAASPAQRRRQAAQGRQSVVWWAAGCALALCLGLFAFQPGTPSLQAPLDGSCTWRSGRDEAAEAGSPRAVVLSCVACHLNDRAAAVPRERPGVEIAAVSAVWPL